ncbi:MAG: TRAP transporter small permease [Syntrophaceae bacterium]|nr:TRAP transporter small permease [Syntrophaceae bacterium]
MTGDHGGGPPVKGSDGRRIALAAADGMDRCITRLCRFIVLVTGIALTVLLTGNVVARYVLASGGIDAAQELPELLFPWFIVAGIALAAQAGGHLGVDWLYDRLGPRGRVWLLHLVNAVVIASYLTLCWQSLLLAENTWVQVSPVLKIPTSQGYLAVALGCLLLALAAACSSVRVALIGPERRFTLTYKET